MAKRLKTNQYFISCKGFSLLEIVIAMLILSLVVAGLFGLFVSSSKFITESRHRLQALEYAKMVAENLKVYVTEDPGTPQGASVVWLGSDPTVAPLSLDDIDTIITGVNANANCNYFVIQGSPGAGMNQVRITVNWTET